MAKIDFIEVKGSIKEVLPNGLFRVEIETGQIILAHIAGRLRVRSVKIVKGDTVLVEISPYDLTRGRIVRRPRNEAA
jgi:translation initiation factor IF-1